VILRNRSIAALLTAEVLSSLGSRMTWLALPWFVLVTTGSPRGWGSSLRSRSCRWRCSGSQAFAVVAGGLTAGTLLFKVTLRRAARADSRLLEEAA